MTEDELVKKMYNKLDNMDESMKDVLDSLIEYWATAKMTLFVAFCKNRELLLNKKEKAE